MSPAKLALAAAFAAAPMLAATCDSLSSLTLPDTTITSVETVAAGAFTPPAGGRGGNDAYKELPAFCRFAATLKPSSDSDIKLEVWLPMSGWNHKYQAAGNGAWAGSIVYNDMAKALRAGYATSSTDTGHTGGNGAFALGHPEKLADFGWRSEHEMTLKAKAVIAAFYGDAPKLSYWVSCSSGGKQGLKEAQRFPADYDGIVAGAPVVNWTHRAVAAIWAGQAALKDPASTIPPNKYPLLHQAVITACDDKDGLKDGIISDPARCKFDPKELECKDADGPSCLTSAQVEAARKIYTPATNPRTGEIISARYEPGSELGWRAIAGGPEAFAPAIDHFRFVVFKDPKWDWRALNFDSDVALADKIDDGTINAIDPDLKAFTGHGGKLIMYQGYADTNIPPGNAITYYDSVSKTIGSAKTADSIRLYMAPGMNHCGGGEGPNVFDMVSQLEQWVENKKAPDQIVAAHTTEGKVDRTRPLCPYPQVAKYKGTGSIDEAANFTCKLP
ncbi:MAG TPA: tannase/feruloyl esterase family alpha/beta hydrolase [Bryobacteraceae bacterium]|nr:tannase/feruloyl esterase family alpha/beta hydrolase [Bryobacteraceae bacterium]